MSVITEVQQHTQPGARGLGAQLIAALRMFVALTVILGVLYPFSILAAGRLPFWSDQADGSLLRDDTGQVTGSALLGQGFVDGDGAPLPQWFQSRPSAAGDGWDGASSGASNLGPNNPELISRIAQDQQAIARFNSVPGHTVTPDQVPADAVTTSGSGLDPQISPAYARLQVARVAQARSLDAAVVQGLVDEHTSGRTLGFIGEPHVDVLLLNRALAGLG